MYYYSSRQPHVKTSDDIEKTDPTTIASATPTTRSIAGQIRSSDEAAIPYATAVTGDDLSLKEEPLDGKFFVGSCNVNAAAQRPVMGSFLADDQSRFTTTIDPSVVGSSVNGTQSRSSSTTFEPSILNSHLIDDQSIQADQSYMTASTANLTYKSTPSIS